MPTCPMVIDHLYTSSTLKTKQNVFKKLNNEKNGDKIKINGKKAQYL